MGIHLIKASQHIYWLQMIPSRTDRLVLDAMAMQALDTPSKDGDPPNLYFGGRDALIFALSDGIVPEEGTPAYRTQARKVRACLQRLIEAGAIERIEQGKGHRRSVYKLTLGGDWRGT